MAIVIPGDTMEPLEKLAAELLALGDAAAPGVTYIHDGATDQRKREALAITSLNMAFQALLRVTPFSELGLMIALGSVTGTVMAQCVATLREVSAASEPVGAVQ